MLNLKSRPNPNPTVPHLWKILATLAKGAMILTLGSPKVRMWSDYMEEWGEGVQRGYGEKKGRKGARKGKKERPKYTRESKKKGRKGARKGM
jgi:hypothetical protein